MGCGVSKDDIAEPRPMQSHGRDKVQLTGKLGALKPIQVTSIRDPAARISSCISSSIINNPGTPPSVFIHTPDSLSSDEDGSDLDSSYDFPSNRSIEEVEENVSRTTALAALSGEKTRTDKEDEERVEAIIATDEVLSIERSQECSTCPLGMMSGAAVFQALMSTVPGITQQNLAGDLSKARVGRVAVISGSEPIRWETPFRKAEIIDLDEETDVGEMLMLETTHDEKQEDQSDQEHKPPQLAEAAKLAEPAVRDHQQENPDQESASSLTEQPKKQATVLKFDDAVDKHKTLSGPEPRKPKLPPLTISPPILVEIRANPFGKPALPIVVKQDFLEVKIPADFEAEQFEDLSGRTPLDLAAQQSANDDNDDLSKSSPVTEQFETPTPATKSSADSEWRSLHSNTPDPDIEDIVLLESQVLDSLDSLPLIPTLECHAIHMDKKDLISPSLRLIS